MLNIRKASEYLDVPSSMLRQWEKDGKLKAILLEGKQRSYKMEQLLEMKKELQQR